MNPTLRKVLAIVVLILTIFGWYLTAVGLPGQTPVKDKIQRGLDIEGGVYVVLEAQGVEDLSDEELRDQMERAQTVIKNRVDGMGLTNPNVRIEGGNRIRVELPGVEDADEAIELVGRTAQLRFVLADQSFILDGSNVKNAAVTTNTEKGGYAVELEFDSEGTKAFTEATTVTSQGGVESTLFTDEGYKVPNNSIVIMLDSDIISYPTAEKVISQSTCIIEGNFTQEEAAQLAALIRGGALPVELQEISSSSQTATIGIDAFHKSVMAGIIGLAIIFILMICGYRLMGVAADLALALYVVLILAMMALMGSVLTLPGIAGIILSIGMAVDANVIIFTRIKEEIVAGKSVRVAVGSGYRNALSTVIDAQVTTLIATVILYQLGTSSVKGFAWTLMIGIIASIFTAVVVTQLYLQCFADTPALCKPGYFGIKPDGTPALAIKKQFKFIKNRKIYFIASCAVIVVGLVIGMLGGFNRGIDFTGGTMIQMDMHKFVSAEEIKEVAGEQGINTKQMEIVYTGSGREQAIIKTNESLDNEGRTKLVGALEEAFGTTDKDVLASQNFGPTVGKELTKNALISLLLAAIGMLIYIRLRFRQWRYGAAAIAGVLHDVFILMAFYGIFHVTINNPFIAAILTVVGYSINDTIVIFDRVRENYRLSKISDTEVLLDTSINQTLSRSIMTSMTTLIVMIPMLIMAGVTVREFVLPLMVGVLAGTYSSIFICSPLYFIMSKMSRLKSDGTKHVKKNTYKGAPKSEKKTKAERDALKAAQMADEADVVTVEDQFTEEGEPLDAGSGANDITLAAEQAAIAEAKKEKKARQQTPQARSKTKKKKRAKRGNQG